MLQIYKSPLGFPNYIPFGMALRALGQGLKVGVVGANDIFKEVCIFLERSFPGEFSYKNWGEKEVQYGSSQILFFIEPNSYDGAWEWVDGLLKEIKEKQFLEAVIIDYTIPKAIEESANLFTEIQVTSNKTAKIISKIITGTGKGKTTYALGEALYYASLGYPSLVLQFIKSPKEYGEVKAIKRLANIEIRSMGKGFPPEEGSLKWDIHRKAVQEAWQYFLGLLNRPRYGLIVLDEINIALKYGYLELHSMTDLLKNLSQDKKISLTGRYANPELFPYVDQIIHMKEIRHPYQMGIRARRGIEF